MKKIFFMFIILLNIVYGKENLENIKQNIYKLKNLYIKYDYINFEKKLSNNLLLKDTYDNIIITNKYKHLFENNQQILQSIKFIIFKEKERIAILHKNIKNFN